MVNEEERLKKEMVETVAAPEAAPFIKGAAFVKKGAGKVVRGAGKVIGGAVKGAGTVAGAAGGAFAGAYAERRAGGEAAQSNIIGWFFFLLSLLLYYFIDWNFRYNGIDLGFFFNLNAADWFFKSGIMTVFLILVLYQIFLAKPKSRGEFGAAIFLDFVIAMAFILARYSPGALYHLIFAIGMWLILIKPTRDPASAYKIMAVLILIDFIGFSALRSLFEITPGFSAAVGYINYMIIPIYSLYLLEYLGVYGRSRLASIMLFIILCLYVFGFVQTTPQYQSFVAELSVEQKEGALTFWQTSIAKGEEFISITMDPLACLMAGAPDQQVCVTEREAERRCADKKGTPEYEKCVKGEQVGEVSGTIDDTIPPTKVAFEKSKFFPKQFIEGDTRKLPMQINIENPRGQEIEIAFSCKLKKGQTEIPSKASPESKTITKEEKTATQIIGCEPTEPYKAGSYTATFEAEVYMQTPAGLKRLLIGDQKLTQEERNKLIAQHSLEPFSKGPEEFATYSIGFGNPPQNPLLDDSENQLLMGNIENKGDGIITQVHSVSIQLVEGMSPTDGCLGDFYYESNQLTLKQEKLDRLKDLKKETKEGSIFCDLIIDPVLRTVPIEEEREIKTSIEYSYKIETKEEFKVLGTLV